MHISPKQSENTIVGKQEMNKNQTIKMETKFGKIKKSECHGVERSQIEEQGLGMNGHR